MLDRTVTELADLLARREITAEALTGEFLQAIRRHDPHVRAFLHVDDAAALEHAQTVDRKRHRGEQLGPLAGVPVAIKDILATRSQPTTCGSKMLQNYRPPYDAHVVSRLRQADVVLIGRTNLDEFAMGSSTETSAFQITRNPWDLERIPGGSSGGSAAAVAAGESPLALGSDTGGSIRQPAALCGIVGLKPSYGRVSRFGLVAFASSLDQIGPFSRDVTGAALLLDTIAGHDPRDSTSVDQPPPASRHTIEQPIQPLVLGIAREHFEEGLDGEVERSVREALKVFESLGAKIEDISLPHSKYAIATYYVVATAEASSNLARYDGVHFGHRSTAHKDLIDLYCRSRGEGFGAEVKRRIMLGTYALSSGYKDAYYLKALKVRRLIHEDFVQAFARCDAIVGPTYPTAAFKIGERVTDPLAMYLADIYTIGANLAGLPGISVPCGFTNAGLPIGLQILSAPFAEEKLLRIARMFERATDWHTRRPKAVS